MTTKANRRNVWFDGETNGIIEAHPEWNVSEICQQAVRERAGMPDRQTPIKEFLTKDELKALKLSGELANLCGKIIGKGSQGSNDWNELAQRIHAVQHTIMAQAAARAYPDLFRLLGRRIGEQEAEPSDSD